MLTGAQLLGMFALYVFCMIAIIGGMGLILFVSFFRPDIEKIIVAYLCDDKNEKDKIKNMKRVNKELELSRELEY